MALLETLPEEVENTLRDMRAGVPSPLSAAKTTAPLGVSTLPPSDTISTDYTASLTPDDEDRENAPIPTAENPLVFETDLTPEGAFHPNGSSWTTRTPTSSPAMAVTGPNCAIPSPCRLFRKPKPIRSSATA